MTGSTTSPRFADAPLRRVHIDGIPVAFRDVGEGPPVLLLHGWPTDGRTFAPLVDALADRYRCIVPDLPGAGDTPWPGRSGSRPHDLSPRGQARIIGQLVDSLGIADGLTVAGNDSGGMVARWLASTRAPSLRGLVLLNTELPGHRAPHQRRARLLARWFPGYTTIAMRQLARPEFLTSSTGFGGTLFDHQLLLGSFRERFLDPLLRSRTRMDAARRSFVAVLDWRQLDLLADAHRRITAPTWFIWGADDPTFPIDRARRMQAEFPDVRAFQVVARARLYVHEDQPGDVAGHVRRILAELHT